MKNTDHHKAFLHNDNVLVIFTGNHTYVSGTLYSNPHTASTLELYECTCKRDYSFSG